jgi:hypothetical protein
VQSLVSGARAKQQGLKTLMEHISGLQKDTRAPSCWLENEEAGECIMRTLVEMEDFLSGRRSPHFSVRIEDEAGRKVLCRQNNAYALTCKRRGQNERLYDQSSLRQVF